MLPQRHHRVAAIESLGNSGRLCEIQLPNGVDKAHYISPQICFHAWQAGADDLQFFLEAGIIDPVVKASSFECVAQLASAVGSEDHVWNIPGLDCAHLRNANLKVGEQLQQEGLEGFVGAVDLIDEQYGRSSFRKDGLKQGPLKQKLLAENVPLFFLDGKIRFLFDFDG